MKKNLAIAITILAVLTLGAVYSRALFTHSSIASPTNIGAGTLNIGMKLEDIAGAPEPGLQSDIKWLPGEHREALLTIENRGSMDARWRLGIRAKDGNSPDLLDEMVLSVYRPDGKGEWELLRSKALAEYLISSQNQAWIYDRELLPNSQAILKPKEKVQLVLQFDFELTAMSPTQDGVFNGELNLEGAQPGQPGWECRQEMPLKVEGGEV